MAGSGGERTQTGDWAGETALSECETFVRHAGGAKLSRRVFRLCWSSQNGWGGRSGSRIGLGAVT